MAEFEKRYSEGMITAFGTIPLLLPVLSSIIPPKRKPISG
jgi:hypothetical protein